MAIVLENFTMPATDQIVRQRDGRFPSSSNRRRQTLEFNFRILGTAYDSEPITLPLPEGVSLDDFTHLSLWCVAFDADFGSGEFQPPALAR